MDDEEKPVSVSGTLALPHYEHRKTAKDELGAVERAVAEAWAEMNIRQRHINYGAVPVDDLCVKVELGGGKTMPDPHSLQAVNSTIQWLFATGVGRYHAKQLMAVEAAVLEERRAKENPRRPGAVFASPKS